MKFDNNILSDKFDVYSSFTVSSQNIADLDSLTRSLEARSEKVIHNTAITRNIFISKAMIYCNCSHDYSYIRFLQLTRHIMTESN